jgi:hypothetical protein
MWCLIMVLWWRVRKGTLLTACMGITGVTLFLFGGESIAVPTVIGGGVAAVGLGGLLPLGWAGLVALAFEGKRGQAEARPARRLAVLDACLAGSVLLATFSLFHALAETARADAHAVILVSLAMSLTVLLGSSSAAMGATALLLVTQSYSPRNPGAELIRVLQPEGLPLLTWSLAVVLSAIALGSMFVVPQGDQETHAP